MMLKDYIDNPISINRLQFLLKSLQDLEGTVTSVQHLENNGEYYITFKNNIFKQFYEEFMTPIIHSIDEFLRVNIHAVLLE